MLLLTVVFPSLSSDTGAVKAMSTGCRRSLSHRGYIATLNDSHVAEETAVRRVKKVKSLPLSSENGATLMEKEERNDFTPSLSILQHHNPHGYYSTLVLWPGVEIDYQREEEAREIYGACLIPVLDPMHAGFPPKIRCDLVCLLWSNALGIVLCIGSQWFSMLEFLFLLRTLTA